MGVGRWARGVGGWAGGVGAWAWGRPDARRPTPDARPPADRYQLLADLLVGRVPATPVGSEARWMELVALAGAEGVGPLLHRVLCSWPNVDVPAAASEALAKPYLDEISASW